MKSDASHAHSLIKVPVEEKANRQDNLTSSIRDLSPLRYPGGKGRLAKFLAIILQINDCVGCHYYEPFAGGAGAAFRLLVD